MRIAEAQLARAIGMLEEAGAMSGAELAQAIRQFMTRKRLLKRSTKMARAMEVYEQARTRVVPVRVTVSHAFPVELKHTLEEQAQALLGSEREKVAVTFYEDKSLLGGVKFETDDTRYDFSLARSLHQLRKSLCK